MVSEAVPAASRLLADPVSSGRSGVGRRQRWIAWLTMAVLALIGVAATPFDNTLLIIVPGIFPLYGASMFVVNLMLAALLFIKGHIEGRGDSVRLGTAYFFVCLVILPQVASFPGALMLSPVFGTAQTPVWIWCFLHVGFGIGILRYAWFAGWAERSAAPLLPSILAAVAAMAVTTYVAAYCTAQLPLLLAGGYFVFHGPALAVWGTVACVSVIAFVAVVRLQNTPEQLWLAVGMVANCLEVWLTLHGAARYTLGWDLAKASSLFASITVLISLIYDITWLYSEAAASNQRLEVLASLDSLTGLANRRRFDELLVQELRRARRQCLPLALVLLDVDSFKAYNDGYGHPMGDECLRRVSAAVKDALWRPADHAARYGGEEIAVILPGTEIVGAILIAERIRASVAALAMVHEGSVHGIVTISAGLASVIPSRGDESPAALVSAADRALYRAKRDGRNRVCGADLAQESPAGQPAKKDTALVS